MNLYEILLDISKRYASFYDFIGSKKKQKRKRIYGSTDSLIFDLESKSIHSGKYYIIKNGKLVRDRIMLTDETIYKIDTDAFISRVDNKYQKIEDLFEKYYFSTPSSSESKRSANFKTARTNDMSLEQIENGMGRCEARYALEAFVLLSSISNYISWPNEKHFFWKSEKYNKLILFRSWIKSPQ